MYKEVTFFLIYIYKVLNIGILIPFAGIFKENGVTINIYRLSQYFIESKKTNKLI
jgi:hypothetical protein